MKQLMSKRLPHTMENVCLATDEDCQMYAVGSKVSTNKDLLYFIQILMSILSGSYGPFGQPDSAACEEDPVS